MDPTHLYEVTVPDYLPAEEGRLDRSAGFTVTRRTMAVQMRIECEYARQTEGLALVTDFLSRFAGAMADLKVLVVKSPPGWDPEQLDATDPANVELLFRVWEAIREQEITFRRKLAKAG
ncbi:MAG: hypothetical protein WA840_12790 [Caulobacteraceae bacterium]